MIIGMLYRVNRRYWMLYPSKRQAVLASGTPWEANIDRPSAVRCAEYRSKELNCNVVFVSPNSILVLLEQDANICNANICKILTGNGECGWIIYPENEYWAKGCIEEVKQ